MFISVIRVIRVPFFIMAGERIFIVEDEIVIAKGLRHQVQRLGYDVAGIEAAGEKAIERIEDEQPDLALMDIHLAGDLDGVETAQQIRERFNIPSIFLTAYADDDTFQRAKVSSPSAFLIKPVQMRELRNALEIAFYKRTAEQQIAHLNAVLRAVRGVNRLITHEKDPDRLIQRACEILIEMRGFSFAKILLLDASGNLEHAFASGLDVEAHFSRFLEFVHTGHQPYCLREGLATQEVLVIQDVPAVCGECPLASLFENDRKIIVRVQYNSQCYGLLAVSLPLRVVPEAEEQALLKEAADDIAFALHSIEVEAEHKQAEEALRISEDRFRELFNNMSSGVAVYDVVDDGKDFVFKDFNRAGERIDGVNKEDLLGRSVVEMFPGVKDFGLFNVLQYVWRTGKPRRHPVTIYQDKRIAGWRENYVYKLPSGEIVAVYDDVTDRKRAELELEKYRHYLEELVDTRTKRLQKEVEERKQAQEQILLLKNAIETTQVGVTITDRDRKILFVNQAEAVMHGYSVKEVLGKDVRIFAPSEYWQDIKFEQLDHHWERETVNIRKDGTTFPVHSISTPVRSTDGAPAGVITISDDITERKRVEEDLKQAKDEAETANRYKSEFLANMSHDIRTPMNAILGFSEILSERLEDFPEYQDYLQGIMSSGRNLLRLINDILDLSKIEAGRLDIQREPVDVRGILSTIQNMFGFHATEKGLTFDCQCDPGVPSWILFDGTRLQQILVNLVGNAIKFTRQGAVALVVRHAAKRSDVEERHSADSVPHDEQLLFEIRDTGPGISEDDQQRIFEPFHQAKYTAHHSGGSGLGLAITKRLVEMMDGTISVESTPGEGSLFRILLRHVTLAEIDHSKGEEEVQQDVLVRFQQATVLLVEDNDSNRMVIRGYLAAYESLHIVEAHNGQEALDALDTCHPDIILMDIHMPVMNGHEATRRIKANPAWREIPVAALTAYAMKQQQEALQGLYDAYITKPIAREELLDVLLRFLPQHQGAKYQDAVSQNGKAGARDDVYRQALQDFLNHTESLPYALQEALQDDLLPRHRELCEVMSADELLEFSQAIIGLAGTFDIPPLQTYGEALQESISTFNILTMKKLLALFPGLAREIIQQ